MEDMERAPHLSEQVRGSSAVAEGFEPSEGGYPSHAFEACSLGRSDTPPLVTLPEHPPDSEIAWREG